MERTLVQGQTVLVSSIPYLFSKPKTGDIVAFKKNEKVFIKRILKVDEDRFFVRGDNERDSLDSRNFGRIERKDVVGKVVHAVRFQ